MKVIVQIYKINLIFKFEFASLKLQILIQFCYKSGIAHF